MGCTPELSLRGRFAPVAISRTNFRIRRSCPVIHPGPARLPRRFAPRNDTSGWRAAHQCPYAVEFPHTGRSLPVRGTPHPYGGKPANGCAVTAATPHTSAFSVLTTAGTGRQCLPEIATAPSGPRNDTSGEHGAGNGALHRISRPIAASRTGLAVPDPTVTSLPIQTCKKKSAAASGPDPEAAAFLRKEERKERVLVN